MTYSELLHSVSFDEIMPYIEKYHGHTGCTALYKTHYDMLRQLTPHREEGDNATATISNAELDYTWEEPHLDGYPLEGDLWEVSLAKELIIAPDVDATPAEIAMCCLWHTSFFGFTLEQVEELNEKNEYYIRDLLDTDIIKDKAARLTRLIEEAGGKVPYKSEMFQFFRKDYRKDLARIKRTRLQMPGVKNKKIKRTKRRISNRYYRERIAKIGKFIEACLPIQGNGIPITDLCKLFYSHHLNFYNYQSYSGSYQERTSWMMDLIDKYNAFDDGVLSNVMVCLAVAPEHPFAESEHALLNQITALCPGKMTYMIKTDEHLGQELKMNVAFYE
jgi:hypothetical protein